jgi:hypothetical protein
MLHHIAAIVNFPGAEVEGMTCKIRIAASGTRKWVHARIVPAQTTGVLISLGTIPRSLC